MKKYFTTILLSLVCALFSLAQTNDNVIYSWSAPNGTPVEIGGNLSSVTSNSDFINKSWHGYNVIQIYKNQEVKVSLDFPISSGDEIFVKGFRWSEDDKSSVLNVSYGINNSQSFETFQNIYFDREIDEQTKFPEQLSIKVKEDIEGLKEFTLSLNSYDNVAATNITEILILRDQNRPEIIVTSPELGSTLAKLEKDSEIKFTTLNINEPYIHCYIKDEASDECIYDEAAEKIGDNLWKVVLYDDVKLNPTHKYYYQFDTHKANSVKSELVKSIKIHNALIGAGELTQKPLVVSPVAIEKLFALPTEITVKSSTEDEEIAIDTDVQKPTFDGNEISFVVSEDKKSAVATISEFPITEPGSYELQIPKGYFLLGDESINEETTYVYEVVAREFKDIKVVNEVSELSSLDQIIKIVSSTEGEKVTVNGENQTAELTDPEGNTLPYAISQFDDETVSVDIESERTVIGTYTLHIPEGALLLGDCLNNEATITFEVVDNSAIFEVLPVDGSEVSSLSQRYQFKNENGIMKNPLSKEVIYFVDANGKKVTGTFINERYKYNNLGDGNKYEYELWQDEELRANGHEDARVCNYLCTFSPSSIVDKGEYTMVIPAGFFLIEDGKLNRETRVNYSVTQSMITVDPVSGSDIEALKVSITYDIASADVVWHFTPRIPYFEQVGTGVRYNATVTGSGEGKTLTLEANAPRLAKGAYKLVIPADAFYYVLGDTRKFLDAAEFTYTLTKGVEPEEINSDKISFTMDYTKDPWEFRAYFDYNYCDKVLWNTPSVPTVYDIKAYLLDEAGEKTVCDLSVDKGGTHTSFKFTPKEQVKAGKYMLYIPAEQLKFVKGSIEWICHADVKAAITLDPKAAPVAIDDINVSSDKVTVYNLQGVKVAEGNRSEVLDGLRGLYIVNGKKIMLNK